MRKMLLSAVLAGTTLFVPGLIPQARADHEWFSIGSVFRVGAAHIAIAFGRPFGYQPAYYYRYDRPISYRGHSCSRQCFRDSGYYYHHESCPLVGAHFSHYRTDPYYVFDRYAPRHDGYRDDHDYGGRYDDRYDRYDRRGRYDDRYDRHDRHDRYDRRGHRGRGRGHRHYDGCGH
jgi:hypothetical protein